MADRALVPPGRLHELSFQELDSEPLRALQRLYEAFGWVGAGRRSR